MRFDENIIKEKRTIEATKKEYMGSNGKLATICKMLGDEIINQGDMSNNFITYDNFWNDNSDNNIKYMSENTPVDVVGYYFYGLNYSCNIEIFNIEAEKKIEVIYRGQKVYLEYNNELESYIPGDWEGNIDRFYSLARDKQDRTRKKEKEKMKQQFENKKYEFFSYIKNKWGI